MDSALLATIVTAGAGLLGMAISKFKCKFVQWGSDDEPNQWQCGIGFSDTPLIPENNRLESHELRTDQLLYYKKAD